MPKQCPSKSPARDSGFAASVAWSSDKTPGVYQFEPTAVLTADGGTTAVFITRAGIGEGNVLGTVHVDGKGVRTDGTLPTGRANAFDPWLARDKQGTLYAVWLGFATQRENQEIGFATSRDHGLTWSKPIAVHEPADCASSPASGGAGDGHGEQEEDCLDKPMVIIGPSRATGGKSGETMYVTYSSGEAGLRVRASRDGGVSWTAPVTALVGIYGNGVVGSDGTLHLVTLNGGPHGAFGSAMQKVEYTASTDGGATFKQPVTVSGENELLPFFFSNPSIAVDSKRKLIYVAYVRGGRDAVWDIVLATSKDKGATWSRRTLAGDGCAIHMVPSLVLDEATGALHIAYYDSEVIGATASAGRFVHARCSAGGTKCQVLGAINTQPFAALSTERHGAKWIGEYEALLVDAKRKLIRAVWAQPVGDPAIARIMFGEGTLSAK